MTREPSKASELAAMGESDNLSQGQSTFMVEMSETAAILQDASKDSLVIVDEIGRGTSTFDGLSLAWAVAEYLDDVVQCRGLFATHYHELVELERECPQVKNFHMAVKEFKGEVVFLRELKPGGTSRSYGIEVAKLAGLPRRVIDRARELLLELATPSVATPASAAGVVHARQCRCSLVASAAALDRCGQADTSRSTQSAVSTLITGRCSVWLRFLAMVIQAFLSPPPQPWLCSIWMD